MIKDIKQFMSEVRAFMAKYSPNSPDKVLLRHLLGSIDISDVKQRDMSDGARKEFLGRIESSYRDIKLELESLLDEQKEYIAKEADSLLFPRGSMNGILLAIEHFDSLHSEYLAKKIDEIKPEEQKSLAELLEAQSRSGISTKVV